MCKKPVVESLDEDSGVPEVRPGSGPDATAKHPKLKWYLRRPKRLHVDPLRYPGSKEELGGIQIPAMKMRGIWMHQLGFTVGTWVNMDFNGRSLILTPEERPAKVAVKTKKARKVQEP